MTTDPPLPPLSTLPRGIYPPSAYPSPSYFESILLYPALVVPARRTGEIQSLLKDLVSKEPKRKSVYPPEEGVDYSKEDVAEGRRDPRKERKLVLVRAAADRGAGVDADAESIGNDPAFRDPRVRSLLESAGGEIRKSSIRLPASPYALLTVDQVLRRLLPTSAANAADDDDPVGEIPSSFEIAGHIAHVNLRSESLPYKYLIGRAVADKNPRIRAVVNKVGNIENEFRTFPMEIVAGEGLDLEALERLCSGEAAVDASGRFVVDASAESGMQIRRMIGEERGSLTEVEVREHGCRFKLDFARVYWNSRLQGEHARLVRRIVRSAENGRNGGSKRKECVVADAMAGVGPFAVPLTSANAPHFRETPIVCHANDLNPVSYEYLRINAKNNKCHADRLTTCNTDARRFIRRMNEDRIDPDHFIMNLPRTAPEFLDAFRGWKFEDPTIRPMVHVHCFDEKARSEEDARRIERNVLERCERALGRPGCLVEAEEEVEVRVIRDVGPRKNMLCVSFRLPLEVAGVEKISLEDDGSQNGDAGSQNCDTDKRARDTAEDDDVSSKRSKES